MLPRGADADTLATAGANFNPSAIQANSFIWFSGVLNIDGTPSGRPNNGDSSYTFNFSWGTVSLNGSTYTAPNAVVTFTPTSGSEAASTSYDSGTNTWLTTINYAVSGTPPPPPPGGLKGRQFVAGFAVPVGSGGLPGGLHPVTWSGGFSSQTGASLTWQWSAAVYYDSTNQYGGSSTDVGTGLLDPADGAVQSNNFSIVVFAPPTS